MKFFEIVNYATASEVGVSPTWSKKNGYCFVYISNESSVNVFFDNMQVRHDRGRIIEENHYYAFGLKIAAISSKAYGAPNNTPRRRTPSCVFFVTTAVITIHSNLYSIRALTLSLSATTLVELITAALLNLV